MLLDQVVGGGESVAAAPHDDHVVLGFGVGTPPGALPVLVVGEGVPGQAEEGVFLHGESADYTQWGWGGWSVGRLWVCCESGDGAGGKRPFQWAPGRTPFPGGARKDAPPRGRLERRPSQGRPEGRRSQGAPGKTPLPGGAREGRRSRGRLERRPSRRPSSGVEFCQQSLGSGAFFRIEVPGDDALQGGTGQFVPIFRHLHGQLVAPFEVAGVIVDDPGFQSFQ